MASPVDSAAIRASYFLPYQVAWLQDRSLIKLARKSRRTGFSYAQSYEDVVDILQETEYTPGQKTKKVWFSSADESAAKEYIDYCAMWLRLFDAAARDLGEQVIDSENDIKALCIETSNGGRIHALTSNPNRFRSKGGKVVLDEFAHHKDQPAMWKAALASAKVWGYAIRIISSDKGKGLFYSFCEDTKAGKTGWSLHIVTIQRAVAEGLLDKIRRRKTTEAERAAWLEELRRDCRLEHIWLEEFCCIAQDSQTAYLSHELISSCSRSGILKSLEDTTGDLYSGWDIARKKDLSVFWTIEKLDRRWTRHIEVFEKTKFSVQEDYARFLLRLPNHRRLCLDYTGLGMRSGEMLQEEFGEARVECVTMTGPTKEALAGGIKKVMEDVDFILPDDAIVRQSFHSIQQLVTASNNIRFDADKTDDTGHADHFWAGCLAEQACDGSRSGPLTTRSSVRRKSVGILKGFLTRFK